MNAKQFYAALRKLCKSGWIAKVTETGWIRLGPPGRSLCKSTPITAVCEGVRGKHFHWLKDVAAGKFLGLSSRMVAVLHQAAFGKSQFGRKKLQHSLGLL